MRVALLVLVITGCGPSRPTAVPQPASEDAGPSPQATAAPDAGATAPDAEPRRELLYRDDLTTIERGACDDVTPTLHLCVTRGGASVTLALPAGFDHSNHRYREHLDRNYPLGAVVTDDGAVVACNGRWLAVWNADDALVLDVDAYQSLQDFGPRPKPSMISGGSCDRWVVKVPLHRDERGALAMTFTYTCGDPVASIFEQDVTLHLDGDVPVYWDAKGEPRWE